MQLLSHGRRKGRNPDAETRISIACDLFRQSAGCDGTQRGRDTVAAQAECVGALPDLSDEIGDVAAADHLAK